MEGLTKEWKDGKLKQGYYYIKIADAVFIDFFNAITRKFQRYKEEYIDEVITQVPSYEKLQELSSNGLTKKED